MLKGNLTSAPLADVLIQLADGNASGCLHITSPAGATAKVFLRGGRVYAVLAPGTRPQIGARLVSGGSLDPQALAEALEAQRTELQGWRLGELLVHLGYVDQPVVEAFVVEQVRDALAQLLPWPSGAWKLRINERTRDDVAPPSGVAALLQDIAARQASWASIAPTVHGPDAVPLLSSGGSTDYQMEIDASAWAMLCKVDGERTIAELGTECGFTMYEAGQVVFTLVRAGLLDVEPPAYEPEAEPEPPTPQSDLVPSALASRLIGAFGGVAIPEQAMPTNEERYTAPARVNRQRKLEKPADDEAVAGSISRVSEALASALGAPSAGDDMFAAPLHRPYRKPAPALPEDPKKTERARREAARRARDSEELAAAQADLEAARAAEQVRRDDLLPDGHSAEIVDLQKAREDAAVEAARLEEQAKAAYKQARASAARLAEETKAAEEARLL